MLLPFHICSALVFVLSQMCPIHNLPTCFRKIHFNVTALIKQKSSNFCPTRILCEILYFMCLLNYTAIHTRHLSLAKITSEAV
jgi:transposase